jgi:hypothetical protein
VDTARIVAIALVSPQVDSSNDPSAVKTLSILLPPTGFTRVRWSRDGPPTQPAACHTAFPELTPLGQLFKLNGYVWTKGGPYVPPLAA